MALNPASLNPSYIFSQMLAAATTSAKNQWTLISGIAAHELQVVAQRIVAISKALATGSLTQKTAKSLFTMVKINIISNIAAMTTLVFAAIQNIINAAFTVVRQAVNAAVGFVLV